MSAAKSPQDAKLSGVQPDITLFVYGKLKEGFSDHRKFAAQLKQKRGTAQTSASYPLAVPKQPQCFDPECHMVHKDPHLIPWEGKGCGPIRGEVFVVSKEGLRLLDEFHKVNECQGLYQRVAVEVVVSTGEQKQRNLMAQTYASSNSKAVEAKVKKRLWEYIEEYTKELDAGELKSCCSYVLGHEGKHFHWPGPRLPPGYGTTGGTPFNILVLSCGSSASQHVPGLVQRLLRHGVHVKLVTTAASRVFLANDGWHMLKTLLGDENMYTDKDEWDFEYTYNCTLTATHLWLRQWADLAVVAPVTCNHLAKIAHGIGDTLPSMITNAWDWTRKPLILCPAMNNIMYQHPACQQNLKTLKEYGGVILGPAKGRLSSGEVAIGCMVDVEHIVSCILGTLKVGEGEREGREVNLKNLLEGIKNKGLSVLAKIHVFALRLRNTVLLRRMELASIYGCWSAVMPLLKRTQPGSIARFGKRMLLLAAGGKGSYGELGFVCGNASVEATAVLLEKGVSPIFFNEFGYSPLHVALHNRSYNVVQALLQAGADGMASNGQQPSASALAFRGNDQQMAEIFAAWKQKTDSEGGRAALGRSVRLDSSASDLSMPGSELSLPSPKQRSKINTIHSVARQQVCHLGHLTAVACALSALGVPTTENEILYGGRLACHLMQKDPTLAETHVAVLEHLREVKSLIRAEAIHFDEDVVSTSALWLECIKSVHTAEVIHVFHFDAHKVHSENHGCEQGAFAILADVVPNLGSLGDLVMADMNWKKYSRYWTVPVDQMFAACCALDGVSGRARGLLRFSLPCVELSELGNQLCKSAASHPTSPAAESLQQVNVALRGAVGCCDCLAAACTALGFWVCPEDMLLHVPNPLNPSISDVLAGLDSVGRAKGFRVDVRSFVAADLKHAWEFLSEALNTELVMCVAKFDLSTIHASSGVQGSHFALIIDADVESQEIILRGFQPKTFLQYIQVGWATIYQAMQSVPSADDPGGGILVLQCADPEAPQTAPAHPVRTVTNEVGGCPGVQAILSALTQLGHSVSPEALVHSTALRATHIHACSPMLLGEAYNACEQYFDLKSLPLNVVLLELKGDEHGVNRWRDALKTWRELGAADVQYLLPMDAVHWALVHGYDPELDTLELMQQRTCRKVPLQTLCSQFQSREGLSMIAPDRHAVLVLITQGRIWPPALCPLDGCVSSSCVRGCKPQFIFPWNDVFCARQEPPAPLTPEAVLTLSQAFALFGIECHAEEILHHAGLDVSHMVTEGLSLMEVDFVARKLTSVKEIRGLQVRHALCTAQRFSAATFWATAQVAHEDRQACMIVHYDLHVAHGLTRAERFGAWGIVVATQALENGNFLILANPRPGRDMCFQRVTLDNLYRACCAPNFQGIPLGVLYLSTQEARKVSFPSSKVVYYEDFPVARGLTEFSPCSSPAASPRRFCQET